MTLRTRLAVAIAVLGLAIVGACVVVVTVQRRYLIEQLDRQLTNARPAAFGFFGSNNGTATTPSTAPRLTGVPGDRRIPSDLTELFIGVADADGDYADIFVPGLQEHAAPDLGGVDLASSARSDEPVTVSAQNGSTRYRVRIVPPPPATGTSYLVVALPLDRVDAETRRLALGMGVAGAVTLSVLGLVWWWVVRLGLRPIRRITTAADAIAHGELDHRVDDLPRGTEAEHLGRAFNLMLDERQRADDRLRRFVSDASHELRTPLTSIRGYTELYRRNGLDEPGALDDAMRRVGQEAARMNDLVEDMLLLARLDEGRPIEHGPVDVAELLRDAANDAAAVQPQRPIEVDVDAHLWTAGDENRLRQVFAAVLTNALVHTGPSVSLQVRGHRTNGTCVVDVHDDGPGMPADLAARAFERFVRGDESRNRHQGGSGLGLSIVQSVVLAHGGTTRLDTSPGCGTTVHIELPANGAEPPRRLGEGEKSL